jgi:hypothetical protein
MHEAWLDRQSQELQDIRPQEGPEEWYCLHIIQALNTTFRALLYDEFVKAREPNDCGVYVESHRDESYTYFFSPEAAELFSLFLEFWRGMPCSEPADISQMEIVI